MKISNYLFFILSLTGMLFFTSCNNKDTAKDKEETQDYITVKNDETNTRIYTLKNGLKVYLSVNKDKPRIQTAIAVRTGSKMDPHDATGLSHYLEHLMFKGTKKYGTSNYQKEKPLLAQIDSLFDVYITKTDPKVRNHIYHIIDSISYLASTYAIANEYDKMCSSIGATGTNAYTSKERTVYINDIPSNQVKKWIQMEGERFYEPVFRLFHTELEAVYEEKNRSLDNDGSKKWHALMLELFPTHPYGTQTTIGTIRDLKNPSLTKIKEHFEKYYVPNNMAICMAGDFNPDSVITYIRQKFGKLKNSPVPEFHNTAEKPITSPRDTSVIGPDPASVIMGFRFPGVQSKDADMLDMISAILSNGTAGLIDLDLNQKQKVLGAWAGVNALNDYSVFLLGGRPKTGQTLKEVKGLLLQEIAKIKNGEFPDWLPQAIINNKKIDRIKRFSQNRGRAFSFVQTFISRQDWSHFLNKIDRLSKITKEDIVQYAQKHFKDNYAVVYKKEGNDTTVQKVTKPEITPIQLNRDSVSLFVKNFKNEEVPKLEPVFVNYEKDMRISSLHHGIPLWYKHNKDNNLFHLYYHFDFGSNDSKKISIAANYLEHLGTAKYSPEEIQQEFFKLGCYFNVSVSNHSVYVVLSGLQKNFTAGVALFESLLKKAKPNEEALRDQVANILKSRENAKQNKSVILFRALVNYGKYGSSSPFTYRLTKAELESLKGEELVEIIHQLTAYQHKVMYYGAAKEGEVQSTLNKLHLTPETIQEVPSKDNFKKKSYDENQIYVVNYDMKQAEIIWLSKDTKYNSDLVPVATLYNQYYGGSMASVMFQELRESRALAYSVYSSYNLANKKGEPNYLFAYIGTQEDKMPAAMNAMMELLDSMPKSQKSFALSKENIIQTIRSKHITGTSVFFNYMSAQKLGLDHDIRKDIYKTVPTFTFKDILQFQKEHVKGHHYAILVIGNEKQLDFDALREYGKIHRLSLKDVFGY